MNEREILTLKELAKLCHIDITVIREFEDFGLFPVSPAPEPDRYLATEAHHLEMLNRLRHEMDINLEGIEVIIRMRRQLEDLHREADRLRRQLTAYEQLHIGRWRHEDH